MEAVLNIWEQVQVLISIVFYVGVFAALVLLEKHLIKKRSKGEWILPVVLLVGAMILSAATFSVHTSGTTRLEHIQVFDGTKETGRVIWISSRENGIIALGQYAAGVDERTRFIDLEIEKDKVIGTSIPISKEEKRGIEEIFSYHRGKFTGKSISYEELAAMDEAKEVTEEKVTWESLVHGMRFYGMPGFVLLIMYLWSLIRRKRANSLMKSKLKDI